jgi:hypothetical protein
MERECTATDLKRIQSLQDDWEYPTNSWHLISSCSLMEMPFMHCSFVLENTMFCVCGYCQEESDRDYGRNRRALKNAWARRQNIVVAFQVGSGSQGLRQPGITKWLERESSTR